ncbi:MAG TPA: alpha/beta hydrolase [Caulobacteraceae bacterium]
MPVASLNGQRVFYTDTGGSRPAVIFSHGLLMDHTMFAPQIAALKHRWRCVAWDERGHGATAGDTLAPFSYYDSADDLAALLAHLKIGRAVLAGVSQGGFLSLRCALTHPRLVRALILIDTQAGKEDPARLPGYEDLAARWMNGGLTDDIAGVVEATILGQGWDGAAHWRARWKTMKPANLAACMQTLGGRDDITGRLGEIRVPSLVIHGDADAAIDLALARTLVAGLPDARLVVIPGAGHAANLTHPGPVNAAIAAFLDGLKV